MRLHNAMIAAAGLAAAFSWQPVVAQGVNPNAATNPAPFATGNHMGPNNMTQEQFNQLQDYADRSRRLTKEDKAKGKTLADLMAQDKVDAAALAKAMPLSCDVDLAIMAAKGPETIDGKTVNTETYETACANGMGYFLIQLDPGKPYGISCFAAEATRAADVAAGKPVGAYCQLPPNKDINAMAGAVMSHAGTACTVQKTRWVGQNSATHTEFNEVLCGDGAGYMLVTALPGSTAPVRTVDCHTAAMQGLPCTLSGNASAVVTLETLKDALARHNIACDAASDADMHVFGQENVQKRYVVEFRCSQRPKGLVAYIPLADNKAPFEALDCATAAKRGIKCGLSKSN